MLPKITDRFKPIPCGIFSPLEPSWLRMAGTSWPWIAFGYMAVVASPRDDCPTKNATTRPIPASLDANQRVWLGEHGIAKVPLTCAFFDTTRTQKRDHRSIQGNPKPFPALAFHLDKTVFSDTPIWTAQGCRQFLQLADFPAKSQCCCLESL